MNEPYSVEFAAVEVLEMDERIREGLPRVCKAMAELALSRVQALGFESPSSGDGRLRNVTFYTSYYDPNMPHSDDYKSFKKEWLERAKKHEEDDIFSEDESRMLELETYDALSDEQKVGGFAVANFTMQDGDNRFGMWILEGIGAEMREYDSAYRFVLANSGVDEAQVDVNEVRLRPDDLYDGPISLEVLLRTIDIFEKAEPEDVRITLPVTI